MKSAYELAMERLEKESGATKKLTDTERERIAEIDKIHDAKVAETKLAFDQRMSTAQTHEELSQIQAEMGAALQELEKRREAEKDAIWNQ